VVRPNGVAASVTAAGDICIYANVPTDIVVDLTGYWVQPA
jgi:hypothetical protein